MVQIETVSGNPATPSRWTVVFNRIAVVALAVSMLYSFAGMLACYLVAHWALTRLSAILWLLEILFLFAASLVPVTVAVNLWRFRHYRFVLTATIVVVFLSCSPVGLAVLAYLLISSTKRAFQADGTSVLRPIVVGICLGIGLYFFVQLPAFLAEQNDRALVSTLSSQMAKEIAVLVDKELTELSNEHPVKERLGAFQALENPEMFLYNGGEGIGQTLAPDSFQARLRFANGTVPLKMYFQPPCAERQFANLEELRGFFTDYANGVSEDKIGFSFGGHPIGPFGIKWCASKDEVMMSIYDY